MRCSPSTGTAMPVPCALKSTTDGRCAPEHRYRQSWPMLSGAWQGRMLCPRAQRPSGWYSGGLVSLCFMLKSPGNVNRKSPPTVCPSGMVLLWCGLVGVGPLPLLWLATAMPMVPL